MPRLDKFIQDILENTPHEGQFDKMKTFKEVKSNLKEAVATKTHLQYIRAKTAGNNHFEARRYIADQILRDSKLAMAYKSLEVIHDTYGRIIGNDAVQIRQRLEKMLMSDLKRKVSNWDEVHSAL
tara:strand:+ start:161 stop:535 length:375 start_codon:yes stop_codon:yes gene_type:complete